MTDTITEELNTMLPTVELVHPDSARESISKQHEVTASYMPSYRSDSQAGLQAIDINILGILYGHPLKRNMSAQAASHHMTGLSHDHNNVQFCCVKKCHHWKGRSHCVSCWDSVQRVGE